MMVFRRSNTQDLEAIHKLAISCGFGMTTLPKDKDLLKLRLDWSEKSFSEKTMPKDEYYLFVLEDNLTNKIVGTAAIEACTGFYAPFYSYKLSQKTRVCNSLNIRSDYTVLSLVNDYQGQSELCTLYLQPEYRISGNGLLLSRARFLFIADHPSHFAPKIIAEMRGISNEAGKSPLWDNLGKHFFHMSFIEADGLTISTNKQFIADLMPRNPVYVNLLPEEAQAVIGKPHASTIPAMNILFREGFRYNNYVDIFDGGPTIEAPRDQIKTILASQILKVTTLSDEVSSARFLIANNSFDFRAVISHIIVNSNKTDCIISKKTAAALNLKLGDTVRISPLS